MSFMVLEIWSYNFGKVMEIFLKEFLRTLVNAVWISSSPTYMMSKTLPSVVAVML